MSDFTAIPLSISFSPHTGLEREKGGLEECIDRLLELIVFTPKGSFSADPEFGFEYWNHEFSNLDVREFNNSYLDLMGASRRPGGITRRKCEASLRDTIAAYEPRLRAPEVKVELDVNTRTGRRNMQSKYEMCVTISGAIDDGLGITRAYEKRIAFMVEPIAHKVY